MKREIVEEPEISAFEEQIPKSISTSDLQPLVWIGGETLTQMQPRQRRMVVDKILAAGGLTVNASKSKTGKTTLMVEFCHAVCTGRPALGKYDVIQGPVLYWLADDPNVDRFAESWRVLSGAASVKDFHLSQTCQHLYPDGIINLRKAAVQFHPVLIVVDAYTTIRTPRTKNTDFVKAEYDDMRRLSELAGETGAAVNLIHHQSKAKQADPFDAVAGSYAMSAGPDGRMIVEKLQDTQRLVSIDGRDLDEFQFVYARGADRRLFQVIDGPAAGYWRRLHEVGAKHLARAFSTKDAGEVLGLGDRQARRILTEWEHVGALEELERGRYQLAAHIVEAITKLRDAVK